MYGRIWLTRVHVHWHRRRVLQYWIIFLLQYDWCRKHFFLGRYLRHKKNAKRLFCFSVRPSHDSVVDCRYSLSDLLQVATSSSVKCQAAFPYGRISKDRSHTLTFHRRTFGEPPLPGFLPSGEFDNVTGLDETAQLVPHGDGDAAALVRHLARSHFMTVFGLGHSSCFNKIIWEGFPWGYSWTAQWTKNTMIELTPCLSFSTLRST